MGAGREGEREREGVFFSIFCFFVFVCPQLSFFLCQRFFHLFPFFSPSNRKRLLQNRTKRAVFFLSLSLSLSLFLSTPSRPSRRGRPRASWAPRASSRPRRGRMQSRGRGVCCTTGGRALQGSRRRRRGCPGSARRGRLGWMVVVFDSFVQCVGVHVCVGAGGQRSSVALVERGFWCREEKTGGNQEKGKQKLLSLSALSPFPPHSSLLLLFLRRAEHRRRR